MLHVGVVINFIIRGLNSKMDHLLRSTEGNVGGGGVSDNTVLAAEGRLSHQLTELKCVHTINF